uniref:CSON002582 protein n=1 Tax=Culicoides sonorensis TaxID=179676 RepID=A0A336K7G7_CULSO
MSGLFKDENRKNMNPRKDQLQQMDEKQLKDLLDEAYSYKKYSDRDTKSKIFKDLLKKAELEDKEKISTCNELFIKKNHQKLHSGGSLQNINDAIRFEFYDPTFKRSGACKNKKYPISVTARQCGGGSLPCNFDNVLCFDNYDDMKSKDAKINLNRPFKFDDRPNVNNDNSALSSFFVSSADTVIDIPLLEKKNVTNKCNSLQLCSGYSSVKCIIDENLATKQTIPIEMSGSPKLSTTNLVENFGQPKKVDENGNALNPIQLSNTTKVKIKMKVSKCDRNIKRIFRSSDIEGYRGGEEVETLVNYIENDKHDKSKIKKNKTNLSDDKVKKKLNKKEKPSSRVKRYNSLEDISIMKEFAQNKKHVSSENYCSNKNLDRYSWGKAEISFLRSGSKNADLKVSSNIWSKFSMESLLNDCSGFYLVTNKKKNKKKSQLLSDEKSVTDNTKSKHHLHKKTYKTDHKTNKYSKTRRKSFSSVPQSEISDCSDDGSVQSLPDSYRKEKSMRDSYISYAEIIRKSSTFENSSAAIKTKQSIVCNDEIKPERGYVRNQKNEESNETELKKSSSLGNDLNIVDEDSTIIPDKKGNYSYKKDNIINCKEVQKKINRNNLLKKRPPVIMNDCGVADVNEIIFGFDINIDLLDKQQFNQPFRKHNLCLPNFTQNKPVSMNSFYQSNEDLKNKQSNSDLDNIVNFVSTAWEETIQGLNGKVDYYNAAYHISAKSVFNGQLCLLQFSNKIKALDNFLKIS